MKKIFNKSLIIALAGVALVATSCKEDYLDTAPTDKVESGTALGTAKNAIYALNGIAKTMTTQQAAQSQGFAGENNIMAHYENYASQDYLYNYYASGWSPIMNQKYHFQVSSRYNYYAWYYYYTIIGQANAIIVNIDNIEGKQEERDYVKASALTFLGFNTNDPALSDENLRLAIAYAIYPQDIIDGAASGFAGSSNGMW
ncbi:MAG: RagB/SusD family nutrient uptake outer membrane protein, partial [Prevotella sp.]|nr:RagB/SusD family nutrient uptake outer membrane protein [Prevotella sp.]